MRSDEFRGKFADMLFPSIILFSSLLAGTTAQAPEARIAAALQQVADHVAAKFNCSIAISYFLPGASGLPIANVSVAAGFTDAGLRLGNPTRAALPEDVYVYGSITKLFTAAAILQLIDAGKLAYADTVTSRVDAFLEAVNGTKLETLLGEGIRKVTIAELLHMTSGIGDYDGTKYTVDQFANFAHDFSPIEILRGYVPPLSPYVKPGTSQHYCSTNYILLGMVLAAQAWAEGGPASWQAYDQKASVLPASLKHNLLLGSTFVDAGRCSAYTPVHGFLLYWSDRRRGAVHPRAVQTGFTARVRGGAAADEELQRTRHLLGPLLRHGHLRPRLVDWCR